jgi:hypothetical protein
MHTLASVNQKKKSRGNQGIDLQAATARAFNMGCYGPPRLARSGSPGINTSQSLVLHHWSNIWFFFCCIDLSEMLRVLHKCQETYCVYYIIVCVLLISTLSVTKKMRFKTSQKFFSLTKKKIVSSSMFSNMFNIKIYLMINLMILIRWHI